MNRNPPRQECRRLHGPLVGSCALKIYQRGTLRCVYKKKQKRVAYIFQYRPGQSSCMTYRSVSNLGNVLVLVWFLFSSFLVQIKTTFMKSRPNGQWEGMLQASNDSFLKLIKYFKSSLTLSLLRCIVTEGTVYYDEIPTNTLNLDALRSNITIIPQTVSNLITFCHDKRLNHLYLARASQR